MVKSCAFNIGILAHQASRRSIEGAAKAAGQPRTKMVKRDASEVKWALVASVVIMFAGVFGEAQAKVVSCNQIFVVNIAKTLNCVWKL